MKQCVYSVLACTLHAVCIDSYKGQSFLVFLNYYKASKSWDLMLKKVILCLQHRSLIVFFILLGSITSSPHHLHRESTEVNNYEKSLSLHFFRSLILCLFPSCSKRGFTDRTPCVPVHLSPPHTHKHTYTQMWTDTHSFVSDVAG